MSTKILEQCPYCEVFYDAEFDELSCPACASFLERDLVYISLVQAIESLKDMASSPAKKQMLRDRFEAFKVARRELDEFISSLE